MSSFQLLPISEVAEEFLALIYISAQPLLEASRLIAAIEQAEKAGASVDALALAREQVEAIEAERTRLINHPVTNDIYFFLQLSIFFIFASISL